MKVHSAVDMGSYAGPGEFFFYSLKITVDDLQEGIFESLIFSTY